MDYGAIPRIVNPVELATFCSSASVFLYRYVISLPRKVLIKSGRMKIASARPVFYFDWFVR